ncbi:MAG: hypothetical protein ACKOSQ_10495 [Planctomycetaceae bacterium]
MSSTAQRRDQRRRLLVSWNRAAGEPGATPAASPARPVAEYAAEAHPERQRGPAVLLPTGLGGLMLAALVILVPVIGTATVGAWETLVGRPLVVPAGRFARSLAALAACCDPGTVASLQGWLAQAWLMVAAAVALVVRLMRRHRRDDYRGRYRAWGWMATLLVLAALAGSVPVGPLVAATLVDATGIVPGPQGIGWWIAVAVTAWVVVAPWAVLPLHERMGTAMWLGLALLAWAGAAAAEWLAAGRGTWIVGGRAAWALGAALAAVAMLVAARSVIREVRGQARVKPGPRSAQPARKPESSGAGPVEDVEVRFDAVTESATEDADDDDESATRFVDGSEPEHRHLSKAERKRLKKLARMNRSVA